MTSRQSTFVCLCGPDFTILVDKMKHSLSVDEARDPNDRATKRSRGSAPRGTESFAGSLGGGGPGCPAWPTPGAHLTLLSTALSLAGGLVMGRLVHTTFTGCCSFPPLPYLLLSNLGFGTPYFLRICGQHRDRGVLRIGPRRSRGQHQHGGMGGYLRELVLQHLLWRPDVGEEELEEVARRLGIDLLFAKINVRHFDGLCWCEAQHLLGMGTALKYLREHLPGTGHQLLTCYKTGRGQDHSAASVPRQGTPHSCVSNNSVLHEGMHHNLVSPPGRTPQQCTQPSLCS